MHGFDNVKAVKVNGKNITGKNNLQEIIFENKSIALKIAF